MALTPYIIFQADVDGDASQQLLATASQLCAEGFDELYVLISTRGGNLMAGITIYNVLRALGCKIVMHNVGNIGSIGNAIFLAGEERYACAHSTFMFHGVAMPTSGSCEEKGARELLDGILSNQKRIGDIVAQHTRLDQKDIAALFREARTKDAHAALADGIVTAIRDASIPAGARVVSLVLQGHG